MKFWDDAKEVLSATAGLFAVVIVLAAVWVWEPLERIFSSDEVTVYPAKCYEQLKSVENCRRYYSLHRTRYKINEARAEVTYWMPDLEDTGLAQQVARLVDCAIRDARNWTCQYPDGSGTVTVRDGQEKQYNIAGYQVIYVRKHQWWAMDLGYKKILPFGVPDQFD